MDIPTKPRLLVSGRVTLRRTRAQLTHSRMLPTRERDREIHHASEKENERKEQTETDKESEREEQIA